MAATAALVFAGNNRLRYLDGLGTIPVGPSGYGKHICLVESFEPSTGTFYTIEGNGTGKGPHGERQHGVVKGERRLGGFTSGWHARRLIRFSPSDFAI